MNRSTLLILILWLFSSLALAQTNGNKGITFQGVIKDTSNPANPIFPSVTTNVVVQVLGLRSDGNSCILWEEMHSGVQIEKGYLYLVVGRGNKTALPVLSFKDVFNDKPKTSLTCSNGFTDYTPLATDSRKLRVVVSSLGITADFNMRSAPLAVHAESAGSADTVNGKSATDFINVNTSGGLTQAAAESWFGSTVMSNILSGTYNAPSATTAANVTGVVAVANGGTGASTAAGARTNLGLGPLAVMNPTGTADATTYLRGDGTWAGMPSAPTLAGDVSGAVGANNVDKIKGTAVNTSAMVNGHFLRFSGGAWINGALVAADVPALDWTKITTGKPTNLVGYGITDAVSKNGDTMAGTLNMGSNDLTSTGYVLMSPQRALGLGTYTNAQEATLIGSLSITHKGYTWYNSETNQVKFWNGATAQALGSTGNYMTALTGDVTATGPGSAVATIAVDAVTSSKIANNTIVSADMDFAGVISATTSFTMKDSTGKFTNFACATTGHVPTWTVAGFVCQASASGDFKADGSVNMTGPLKAVAGTAAAPGYTLVGDTNTGMFGAAVDALGFSTAGTERMRLDGSGMMVSGAGTNILIKDTVSGGDSEIGLFLEGDGATGGLAALSDGYTNTPGWADSLLLYSDPVNSGGLRLHANGGNITFGNGWSPKVDRMVIVPSGNIGIGTPTPGSALDVKGEVRMTGATSGYSGFRAPASGSNVTYTLPGTAGSNNQVLTTNGSGTLSWTTPAAGGITSLGGLTAATQTFAIGTSGNSPAFSSATSTHTLNIPMASTASVTAGLISKAEYDIFNGKLSASITSPLAGQHLRYNGSTWVNALVALSSDVTGTLSIVNGGTGATSAGSARTSLGIGTAGTKDTGAVSGNVPQVGVSGITANKMCTSDGTSSIICNTNIPSSQWVSSASDIYFNTGKVAIGSAGADRNLTVVNSSTGQGAVSIQNNNSGGMSSVEFFNQGGSAEGFVGWANSGASGVSNAVVLGSLGTRDVTLFTNNTKVLSAYSSGNVGIGVSGDPGVKLKINGTIASAQVNDMSPTSFDLSLGNTQHTSTGCSGTSWDLVNMVEGATYAITVQNNTHTGACSFTNSGSSFRYQPSNATPAPGHVIYTLIKVGTVVYVSWVEGFN